MSSHVSCPVNTEITEEKGIRHVESTLVKMGKELKHLFYTDVGRVASCVEEDNWKEGQNLRWSRILRSN